jgi:hypothetical protein
MKRKNCSAQAVGDLKADCPRREAPELRDRCDLICPDLCRRCCRRGRSRSRWNEPARDQSRRCQREHEESKLDCLDHGQPLLVDRGKRLQPAPHYSL